MYQITGTILKEMKNYKPRKRGEYEEENSKRCRSDW